MGILHFFRATPAEPAVDYEEKFKAAATELRLANDARDNWRASSKDWEAKFKQSVQDMAGLSDEVERLRKELAEERQLSERFRSERDELRPDAEAMRKKRQDDRDRAQAKRDARSNAITAPQSAPATGKPRPGIHATVGKSASTKASGDRPAKKAVRK